MNWLTILMGKQCLGMCRISRLAYPLIFGTSLYQLALDLSIPQAYDSKQLEYPLVYTSIIPHLLVDPIYISSEIGICLFVILLPLFP